MNSITPLERIRKVYKDKVDAFDKSAFGTINKQLHEEEEKDNQLLEQEDIEVTAEELKAKRDTKFNSAFMQSYANSVSKSLTDHQYRVRASGKSMEIDNM
jgi:hypothetical protein